MSSKEALLTTCNDTQQFSACLWDPTTGNTLHQYKNGGAVAPKCLILISDDHLLTTEPTTPLTHCWRLNSQEPDKKLSSVLPMRANAIATCPKCVYLAIGMGTGLYLYQINSGKLLGIQRKHFQPITCVKFSGSFVLVSGEDGMVVVYKLVSLIVHGEALYSRSDHALPITDLHCDDVASKKCKFVTVSLDNTCKVYKLCTGELLVNLVFDCALTSITADAPFWNLFVGEETGNIKRFRLKDGGCDSSKSVTFRGHSKKVTCLTLGAFNGTLFSGSEDKFVFVWEVESGQVLRRLEHRGGITNVRCVLRYENFFRERLNVKSCVGKLEREVVDLGELEVRVKNDEVGEEVDEDVRRLKEENAVLRGANEELFLAALAVTRKYNNF